MREQLPANGPLVLALVREAGLAGRAKAKGG